LIQDSRTKKPGSPRKRCRACGWSLRRTDPDEGGGRHQSVYGRARIFWVSCGAQRKDGQRSSAFWMILLTMIAWAADEPPWGRGPGVEDRLERAGCGAHWDCSAGGRLAQGARGGNGDVCEQRKALGQERISEFRRLVDDWPNARRKLRLGRRSGAIVRRVG